LTLFRLFHHRILSGYQKNKNEEADILEKLRNEGLLAIPTTKTANSLGFNVVDADHVRETEEAALATGAERQSAKSAAVVSFEPSQFLPSRTIEKMEKRRNVS
jgi:hypothetical protein